MAWGNIVWATARILFGLFFILSTVMIIVRFGGDHPPEAVAEAADFTGALNRSGFANPMLIALFLVAGTALLFKRTAALGLVLLAPAIALITAFHWVLTHSYVWGSIWAIWWLALTWHERGRLMRLIEPA
ncbi:hypothetical protein ACPVPU_02815 [Sphingomonas sp. CJ99]